MQSEKTMRDSLSPLCDKSPYVRLGLLTLAISFGAFLAWALLAPLNSAVVANGRFVVASDNKVVQHLDGGLIEQILVKDGDQVEAGQLLMSLQDSPLQIRLHQVREQQLNNSANLQRLAAERDGLAELPLSSELMAAARSEEAHELLKTQRELFESRRSALASEKRVLEQRQQQALTQLEGSRNLLATLRKRLSLLNEEHQGLKKLAKIKAVSQSRLREVEGSVAELHGSIASTESEAARLRESLAELKSRTELAEREYRKDVVAQLRDLQSQQINLQAEESKLLDQLSRIEIRAPVAGKIKGLNVVTLGAVISAGQALMEIVPTEQTFKIHARVSPMDIDMLQPGLRAEVRIPAFDGSQNRPTLFADLHDVSTDVYLEQGGQEAYYKASLSMDDSSRNTLATEQLKLVSGMPVDVFIRTGERTFADYLMKPFSDMLTRAFNEA